MNETGQDGPGPAAQPNLKKPWETPAIEELGISQYTARRPDPGSDGGVADCSRSR